MIFGPSPRSYRTELDQSKKLIALQTALAEKAKASDLGVFEAITFEKPRTQEAQTLLTKAGITGKVLLVVDKKNENVTRAFANIRSVSLIDAAQVNAWELMAARKVFFTKAALDELAKRWPKGLT